MAAESFFDKIEKIKMSIRILILVGTIIIFSGAFAWLVYIPKTEEISKTEKQIAILSQRLVKAKAKAKNLRKFRAEMAEVEAEFKDMLTLLPNKKEIPSLLRNITKLGTDAQLEFRLFSPKSERSQDFYMEIPVSIEVSGNYHNVAVFFDKVGKMNRIVNILNVTMKPVKARSSTLITKFNAVTYRFKEGIDVKAPGKK
jgi:type IV pilus assembly protein PilO